MTIQWDEIKARVDLRDIVRGELGEPANRTGSSLLWKCPFHHEKTPSFSVTERGFHCFSAKCGAKGDIFTWFERRNGMQKAEIAAFLAVRFGIPSNLVGEIGGYIRNRTPRRARSVTNGGHTDVVNIEPPSASWQFYAERFVSAAERTLWSPEGERALAYLRGRGLDNLSIKTARLGYVRAQTQDEYKFGRVFDPEWVHDGKPVRAHAGITIPHVAQDNLWAVRLRRPPGIDGPKYLGTRGGSRALYWIDQFEPGLPVMLFEGEFDALIAWQVFGPGNMVEINPMALASASNHHIPQRFLGPLVAATQVFVRMDRDDSGSAAANALASIPTAQVIQVPSPHKDLTDFYCAEGADAVRSWAAGLAVLG